MTPSPKSKQSGTPRPLCGTSPTKLAGPTPPRKLAASPNDAAAWGARFLALCEAQGMDPERLMQALETPPKRPAAAPAPAPAPSPGGLRLSQRELAMCKAKGIAPAKYAATRAGIKARGSR